jgi:hypothetical protein
VLLAPVAESGAKNSLTLRKVWSLIGPPAALLGGTKRGYPVDGFLYQVSVIRVNQLFS